MRWRRLVGAAVAWLALSGVTPAEGPPTAILGTPPTYGPASVSAVPNAAAFGRRMWMPGLDSGYTAQGLTVADGAILVAAYRSDAPSVRRGPCRVFRVDPESGRETGHVDIPPPCGHAGGLATAGDGNLYIADTRTLFATALSRAFTTPAPEFRQFPLGPGLTGALAVSTPGAMWIGSYKEKETGRLHRFTAATLAALRDGEMLTIAHAAAEIVIPDHAQGAAIDAAGQLWVVRSGLRWATLDRVDMATGAVARRYDIAAGAEGLAFDPADRLWAVSEAGARHYYDRPLIGLLDPFFPLIFTIDVARLE